MFAFSTLVHLVNRLRRRAEHLRTERLIRNLPPDIRKDIGWPALAADRRLPRRGSAGR